MQKYKLNNGITLLFERKPTKSVVIEVLVRAGSNFETKSNNGASHFIEHMLFEGTKKRDRLEIANEIEKLGGEINAYTSNDETVYYVKVLKKHFEKALDVISDIVINPLFESKSIEKERKVILREIDMVTDSPRFHQWILFLGALFKKHNARNPAYGTREVISRITRGQLIDYYKKYYAPNNMIISVVGNINNPKDEISRYFSSLKPRIIPKRARIIEPIQKDVQKIFQRRKILSSYMILGYKTPERLKKESYVLDVITAILGRGQSGKLFNEIRAKRGLAYDIGVNHDPNIDYGFFAVYLNTQKKNIPAVIKLILEEFTKLKNITKQEIDEAKTYLEGEYWLENEDNFKMADDLAYWESVKDAAMAKDYIRQTKKVTKKEIIETAGKYLNDKYTLAVIEQK